MIAPNPAAAGPNWLETAKRPSPDYPRNFVPQDIDLGDWDAQKPLWEDLKARALPDAAALKRWIDPFLGGGKSLLDRYGRPHGRDDDAAPLVHRDADLVTNLEVRHVEQRRVEDDAAGVPDLGDFLEHDVKLCFTSKFGNNPASHAENVRKSRVFWLNEFPDDMEGRVPRPASGRVRSGGMHP